MKPPREPGRAVLFGLQGTRLRALREMAKDLAALARARRIHKIITLGGGNTTAGDRAEEEILRSLPLTNGFQERGALLETEVSVELARASFGISAQDGLSVTKSGTFMACAAHGLNILSPFADASKPEPLCLLVSPAELLRGLSAEELARRAANLRAWQERVASWSVIAERLGASLTS